MWKLVHFDLWEDLRRRAKKARRRSGAVSYVTAESHIAFGKGDTLIVDATEAAIKSGVTSARALQKALERGARLYSCPGLHAKALVFDDVAVVGSANLSATSVDHKIEAALVTDHAPTVRAVRTFIDALRTTHSTELDDAAVQRLLEIPVDPRPPESTRITTKSPERKLTRAPANRPPRLPPRAARDLPKPHKLDVVPALSLRNQRVVFSGDLASFPRRRREAIAATKRAGGRGDISDKVGPETDIVVIGSKGSPLWKYETLGVNWADALKRKRETGKPLIIDEDTWLAALKRRP